MYLLINGRLKALLIGIAISLYAVVGMAQQTDGGIKGIVRDSAGHVLQGATVAARHLPSGTVYKGQTNPTGSFLLTNLRIGGPYKLTISYIGMELFVMAELTIRLGEPVELNVVLQPAGTVLNEVVVRSGRRNTPRVNRYGAGQHIARAQVANMPMINRSIQDVTRMVPQSTKDNSFAGTNFRYNNITVDGAISNDAIGFSPSAGGITGTSGTPGASTRTNAISLDAIEDMQVYLAPYDVKIGNFTGGSINAVTRSGTNQVTGSVYTFGRQAGITGKDKAGSAGAMNSDFYDWQAGFRVGFPLIRNKLFFFTNAEITRRQDPSQLVAGQEETLAILSSQDATLLQEETKRRYGAAFDPGTAGQYNTSSRSEKFFNRVDWNINANHQLAVRNNIVRSRSVNLDRDQMDFRFSSMAYRQTNNQVSTVAELRSRFNNGWSNSFILGYTTIHDYRTPLSDPSLPQVQIQGRAPGTTIYLGTDREASIFNMKQKTWEITNNLSWHKGRHTFLFGTHNELYNISYGFVNAWNGRVDYLSIEDYLNNNPYRVRGSFNYHNNQRGYILANPEASFNANLLSVFVQDEIKVSNRFQVTPGLRADYTFIPQKPTIGSRTAQAPVDDYFGNTYYYTPLNRINNKFLGKVQLSPRIGFRYDVLGNGQLVLRGGAGIFTGRIPFAWLGYAFYNTGINYGSYDQRADQQPFVPGTDPLKPSATGIADFIAKNGLSTSNPAIGSTQVDVVDNDFRMPKVLRTSLALDYNTATGYQLSLEGIYTKTLKDVFFQHINVKDDPRYYGFDKEKQLPVFSGSVDPAFSNVYELSNTNLGSRFSITGSVKKQFAAGFNCSVAYTYGQSKDVFNGIRNSMESNWQLNQALHPNDPGAAWSNFDIRHRIIASVGYAKKWNEKWISNIHLFTSAQSGSPFSYGLVSYSLQGLSQQVSLAYIPAREETVLFFRDNEKDGQTVTAARQAAEFNNYIDRDSYLSSRRGQFTGRNASRTPWNVTADLHFAQEFHFGGKDGKQSITFTIDIMNVTNLLSASWGQVYFSPNTFNSTASVGLVPKLFPAEQGPGNYPVFTFSDPGKPYAVDYFSSRAQGQVGLRYNF